MSMTSEQQQHLQACLKELASLLYEQTNPKELTNMESIEKTVRTQMLEHVSLQIALFLSNKQRESKAGSSER